MGVFAPPNHLLFMRGTTVMAQRFDPRRLELQGDPFPVAQDVGINTGNSVAGIPFPKPACWPTEPVALSTECFAGSIGTASSSAMSVPPVPETM
jgi:hypothetical protein